MQFGSMTSARYPAVLRTRAPTHARLEPAGKRKASSGSSEFCGTWVPWAALRVTESSPMILDRFPDIRKRVRQLTKTPAVRRTIHLSGKNGRIIDINTGNFGGAEGGTNFLSNHGHAWDSAHCRERSSRTPSFGRKQR